MCSRSRVICFTLRKARTTFIKFCSLSLTEVHPLPLTHTLGEHAPEPEPGGAGVSGEAQVIGEVQGAPGAHHPQAQIYILPPNLQGL